MSLDHVAIIPDGNRRWATAHLLLPWQGHEEGVKRFWEIANANSESEIKYTTFWAGSYSNLRDRTEKEVAVLFKILKTELSRREVKDQLNQTRTSFQVIGEWKDFSKDPELDDVIKHIEQETKDHKNHTLTILFGYDGQREMLSAVESIKQSGEEINAENLRTYLWTGKLPDVDYVIRTGGEPHWSAGFMMWHTESSQFYFTEDLWPDFKTDKLKTAIEDFDSRERRFGK